MMQYGKLALLTTISLLLLLRCTPQEKTDLSPGALVRYYYRGLARSNNPKNVYNNCIGKNYQARFPYEQFDLQHRGLFNTNLEDYEIVFEDSLKASIKVRVFFYTKTKKRRPILYKGIILLNHEEGCWKISNIQLVRGALNASPRNHFFISPRAIRLNKCSPLVISSGNVKANQIALTFNARADSGPAKLDMALIAVLQKHKAPATVFMETNWMIKHQEFVKQIAQSKLLDAGMLSTMGLPFEKTKLKDLELDFNEAFYKYYYFFKAVPRLYRPASKFRKYSSEISKHSCRKYGVVVILWDTIEPKLEEHTPANFARWLIDNVKAGSMIKFYLDGRSGLQLAEALDIFIPAMRSNGFKFVKVRKLRIKRAQKR